MHFYILIFSSKMHYVTDSTIEVESNYTKNINVGR